MLYVKEVTSGQCAKNRMFTVLHQQLAPPALDHIGLFFFLMGKIVFIFLPFPLANCLAPLTIFGTLLQDFTL